MRHKYRIEKIIGENQTWYIVKKRFLLFFYRKISKVKFKTRVGAELFLDTYINIHR